MSIKSRGSSSQPVDYTTETQSGRMVPANRKRSHDIASCSVDGESFAAFTGSAVRSDYQSVTSCKDLHQRLIKSCSLINLQEAKSSEETVFVSTDVRNMDVSDS